MPLRQHPRTLDAGFAALPQMTGRDFSYAYFVFPLRYRTPDKQCGPGRYRGLTAFASLSMAVSGSEIRLHPGTPVSVPNPGIVPGDAGQPQHVLQLVSPKWRGDRQLEPGSCVTG